MRALFFSAWLAVPLSLHGQSPAAEPQLHWYRGNTHTHTVNSDGNAAPDVVTRWYREHGYQFVVITDHEYLTDIAPLNALFGAEEQFLVMRGQEVTQRLIDTGHPDGRRQAHVNSINPTRLVLPIGHPERAAKDVSMLESYRRNISAIQAAGGIPQVNHPTYRWSAKPEDLYEVPDRTLLEIWNAGEHNFGGTDENGNTSLSTEALWDRLLSRGQMIWGVATDDSHDFYHLDDWYGSRPGKAWIVVRAASLTPQAIDTALRQGDFYASTGIELEDYVASRTGIALTIKRTGSTRDDRRFMTRFIGKDGRVLAEVPGIKPRYAIRGNEGYVRASIMSSTGQRGWTQPVFLKRS